MADVPLSGLPAPRQAGTYQSIVIDQLDWVSLAVVEIKSKVKPGGYCPSLAVDLEGVNLGRHGTITVITIATRDVVYIFDILKLGPSAFNDGLKVRAIQCETLRAHAHTNNRT